MAASAEELLRALNAGAPIEGEAGSRILSPKSADAIRAADSAVARAAGREPGRAREVYWITGRPGNGKTQSLRYLSYKLSCITGAGKFAFAMMDLDKESAARQYMGLVPAIVRHSLSSVAVRGVQEVREAILQGNSADTAKLEYVAFGADVLAHLAGLPPVSLIAATGYRKLLKWLRAQDQYLRWRLRQRWSNPQLVEFLGAWLNYVLRPTPPREEVFNQYLSRLASVGRLFDLYCFALEHSGYSTLVLAFDEVDEVSLDAFKPLWDPPVDNTDGLNHKLNMIFVLSPKEHVRENAEKNEAIRRRFCTTAGGHYELDGPRIDLSTRDDYLHVVSKVEELLNEAAQLRRAESSQSPGDLDNLRRDLFELSKQGKVTWQILWQRVVRRMVEL